MLSSAFVLHATELDHDAEWVAEAYDEPDLYCALRYYAGQPEFPFAAFYTQASQAAWSEAEQTEGRAGEGPNEQQGGGRGEYGSGAGWDSNFETSWDSYLKETRTLFGARLHRRAEDDRQFAVNERLARKLAIREVETRLGKMSNSGLIAELEVLDLAGRRARAVSAGASGEELEAADGAEDAAAAMMALIMAHEAGLDKGGAGVGAGAWRDSEGVLVGEAERELVGEALARRTAERDSEVMDIRNRLMVRAEVDRALARDMRQAVRFLSTSTGFRRFFD